MIRIILYVATAIVITHGLVHLMGFVAYWPLAEVAGLPYKTSLLGGRWEIGEISMRYFSALWLAVAAGLLASTIGLALKQEWWLPMMGMAILLSLVICILDWRYAWRGAILSLLILVPLLLAWGLRIQPQPFSPYPEPTPELTTISLPTGLPVPVDRYYKTIFGEEVPAIESAVITARGKLRFAGITFPARMRFTHDAGQGYRHYIEATIFGYPLLKVNERYLGGQARMELPVGLVENDPKIDMAANLGLWGESIWLPSIFVTDSRVRWQAMDDTSARLFVPFGDGQDSFELTFDPETGLIESMEAQRYRDVSDVAKIPWKVELISWDAYQGLLIPSFSTVTWADQGSPWLIIDIDDIAYNVDITTFIRSRGA